MVGQAGVASIDHGLLASRCSLVVAGLPALPLRPLPLLQELLEAEPEAKWALLTLTRLKELRLQVLHSCPAGSAADGNVPDGTAPADLAAEVAEGYARLKQLDPLRRGYYVDAEEGRAHVVAKPAAA